MQFERTPRSFHPVLALAALGLLGMGGFALQWGLRRAIGVDTGAVTSGAAMLLVGGAVAALWVWLLRRPRRDLLEIDPASGQLRLLVDGEVRARHLLANLGPLELREVFWAGPGSQGTRRQRFELWARGVEALLFVSDGELAARQRAAELAAASGLAVEPVGTIPSRPRAAAVAEREARIVRLAERGDEEALLGLLDPLDFEEVDRALIDALARLGREASLAWLEEHGRRSYRWHPQLRAACDRALEQIRDRCGTGYR